MGKIGEKQYFIVDENNGSLLPWSMDLKDFLTANDLTQAEFAGQIGTTQQAVSQWLAGACVPSKSVMAKIYVATGGQVTANDFMRISDPPFQEDVA